MASPFSYLPLLLLLLPFTSAGTVGINYGRIADDLPPPSAVVSLLHSQNIPSAKLYDADTAVLSAFKNSGISLAVSLPNDLLPSAASSTTFTTTWLQSHLLPNTTISTIAVGNEVFTTPNTTQYLIPAINNLYTSLKSLNLHSSIKLSSPLALSCLTSSYPPSSGAFDSALIPTVIKPMLDFLRKTSSFLMINAYPFLAYTANSDQISLSYALFQQNPGVVDPNNGLKYTSLFDAQIDAVVSAMKKLQYDDVPIVVAETGWPSKGDDNEPGASPENAATYNGNLVRRVLTGGGTPLRPKQPLTVYLFALFNEDQKPGPTSERNFGLFYPDEKRVYNVPLTLAGLKGGDAAAENGSKVAPAGQSWCVANGKVADEKLQVALDYACGEGGANCRPIQPGATCYNPNTLEAHASYAFNSYYQRKSRAAGTCDFGGAAFVITQAPRYGSCAFPTGD